MESVKNLNIVRFSNDIVLFAESAPQRKKMVFEIFTSYKVSSEIGLLLNETKTKIVTNNKEISIHIRTDQLQYVQAIPGQTYLGKKLSFKKFKHRSELIPRVNLAWNKFSSFIEILQ